MVPNKKFHILITMAGSFNNLRLLSIFSLSSVTSIYGICSWLKHSSPLSKVPVQSKHWTGFVEAKKTSEALFRYSDYNIFCEKRRLFRMQVTSTLGIVSFVRCNNRTWKNVGLLSMSTTRFFDRLRRWHHKKFLVFAWSWSFWVIGILRAHLLWCQQVIDYCSRI